MDRTLTTFVLLALVMISGALCLPGHAADAWTVVTRIDPPRVHVSRKATDGRTLLSGGCNMLFGAGFTGSFALYRGTALQRTDDKAEPVTFEVTGTSGAARFAGRMHYVARERTWVITDLLPPAFVVALGRGDTLTVRNGKGVAAFSFSLQGATQASEALMKGCDLSTTAADGRKRDGPFPLGPGAYTGAAFARECIKCLVEAHRWGRSVGGYCPVACAEVYDTMICDNQGANCRPGP